MNSVLEAMLGKYERSSIDDHINALREVLQEIALCGLWRGRFFTRAAFYGGSALRILYGLDRFSEDLDFSLLAPDSDFRLEPLCGFVAKELRAWGFSAAVQPQAKTTESAIESAFLKANTRRQLLVIEAQDVAAAVHSGSVLKIKLEVDTDPPPGFLTETRFLLQPIPFSVRAYATPFLFAGKMHAVLCRGWKERVKGRDWYDLVWYVARGTELDLAHLEARMRQSGHFTGETALDVATFRRLVQDRIEVLDVGKARADVERFLTDPSAVEVWSPEFFSAVADRISIHARP